MADKSELKQAAFELAMNELRGRLLYEDYVEKNGKVFREQVSAFATRIAEERKSVDEVRRNVPELAGKSYWWDVPYDITKPVEEFPGTFAFSEGIYTEQDDFEETYGLMLARAKQCDTAHDVFNIYLTFSDYVTLYADRKALKVNPAAKVQRKAIYCAEEELPVQKTVGEYEDHVLMLLRIHTNTGDYSRRFVRLQAGFPDNCSRLITGMTVQSVF